MSNAVKVGFFAAIVLLALAALILKIEDLTLFSAEGQRVDAIFASVAGLDDKAAVRIAGVRIGRVDGVGLDGPKARITLLLETPVRLTEGTIAKIASVGLLGDKYVELVPGPANAAPLSPGAVLPGETPVSLDQAIEQLSAVGQNIEQITGAIAGKEGAGENQISRLLGNLEAITRDVRDLIAANRDEMDATFANFRSTSETLARELPRLANRMEEVLREVRDVVAENRGELAASMTNVRAITESLQPVVADLKTISGRLASGEGTIGKLLTSTETHDRLVSTLGSIESGVESLKDTLGAVQKVELDLGMEGYYLPDLDTSQAGFEVDLKTRSGWRYRLGLADTPFGRERTKTERITTTLPDGRVETTTIARLTREDDLRLTALLGKDLPHDLRLRTGLIENTFGIQAEYPLLDRKLWLSFEAFEFNRNEVSEPHLRLSGRYRLHPNLYVVGGYDDFLTAERNSLFLGAGINWRDDDLKYLLGSLPIKP